MKTRLLCLTLVALSAPSYADSLALPAAAFERSGTTTATYRFDRPAQGTLTVEWTDGFGRVVQTQQVPTQAKPSVAIPIDLRRAITLRQELRATFTAGGKPSAPVRASFIARPPQSPWSDYEIVMWQSHDAPEYQALGRLGISGAKLYAKSGNIDSADTASILAGGMRFYLENLATDFYAPYHMASSTALFDAAQKQYAQNPTGTATFMRAPSLSDPAWLTTVRTRLTNTVKSMGVYRPFFYNLGDETGIGNLAAAWDFDLSPASLAGMRTWLATQYPSLDALNAEWGTKFAKWDQVVPLLTTDALKRTDDNFAGWGDFKAWMDIAYARAIRAGTDALHAADPNATAAIEGGQIPGWGGYNYGILPHTVDLMEIYNEGNNIEIARSINPKLIVLTTSFAGDRAEVHRLWREILLGARGHIIWDDKNDFLKASDRARIMAAAYPELRGGVPAQLIASQPHHDPIAILYSQASFRTRWLLDRRADGKPWYLRRAETEYETDNAWRASMRRIAADLGHLALQPNYVASEMLEAGQLPEGLKVLILPQSIALSAKEADAIARFIRSGGTVLADGEPGLFDQHSRRQQAGMLTAVADRILRPAALQGDAPPPERLPALKSILQQAGVTLPITLTHPDGSPVTDVTAHLFHNGDVTLIGLQRDLGCDKSPLPVTIDLGQTLNATDIRGAAAAGQGARISVTLDPFLPTILATSAAPLPALSVSMPQTTHPGDLIDIALTQAGATQAAATIVQIVVADPAGHVVPHYGRNLALTEGRATYQLPLAANDPKGRWTVTIRDILSGTVTERALTLTP